MRPNTLHQKGFRKVTIVDFSPLALGEFSKRVPSFPKGQLIEGNFFEHQGQYDLILEQTFFCAIDPILRKNYVNHTSDLLNKKWKNCGLLFGWKNLKTITHHLVEPKKNIKNSFLLITT